MNVLHAVLRHAVPFVAVTINYIRGPTITQPLRFFCFPSVILLLRTRKGAEHPITDVLHPFIDSAKNRYLPLLSRNSHTAIGVIPHLADLVAVTIRSTDLLAFLKSLLPQHKKDSRDNSYDDTHATGNNTGNRHSPADGTGEAPERPKQ